MSKPLSLVTDGLDTKPEETSRVWREQPLSPKWLFRGQDEAGRRGWFLRFDVTGLYTRRIGPFSTRPAALACLDDLVATIILEPLLELHNQLDDDQCCVVEGIPRLKGR